MDDFAFKCDPNYFAKVYDPSVVCSYHYLIGGKDNIVKSISSMVVVGDDCYFVRGLVKNVSSTQRSYGFNETIESLEMKSLDSDHSDKILTSFGNIEFYGKTENSTFSVKDAVYSFMAKSSKYYVISPKVFVSSDFRYLYQIASSADFSELFE